MKSLNRIIFLLVIAFCLILCSCTGAGTSTANSSEEKISSALNSGVTSVEDANTSNTATTAPNKSSSSVGTATSKQSGSSSKHKESTSKSVAAVTTSAPKPDFEKFTIAVIPDTQQEVTVPFAIENKLFLNRTKWIADNKKSLNIKMAVHTGDLVNWGNEEPSQFKIAKEAMDVLSKAGIPYVISPGNHDTAAVGVGGSAADPENTWVRVRDTTEFNKAFPAREQKGFVPFDEDCFDNGYITFTAGGLKWLVMSLELWPRDGVIDWANEVAAAHPNHNIIVATHSFLTHDGKIYDRSEYGSNSPQELFDTFLSCHENIKIVLSGHTGSANCREEYGINGNKIACFLGCFHSSDKNPLQLLELDPEYNEVTIRTYVPLNGESWSQFTATVDGLDFIV